MTNGAQTSAYRNVLLDHELVGRMLHMAYAQPEMQSLCRVWNSAIASVRTQWQHLPPVPGPD